MFFGSGELRIIVIQKALPKFVLSSGYIDFKEFRVQQVSHVVVEAVVERTRINIGPNFTPFPATPWTDRN